ncbi:alpha/beta fold hydrolase [Novosphingobium decolorationis]|uniref:Alpha/beta hydrolase n=1 Tax=Novosphingobium decolorationis TaxID=2698673 RepID=A0ABX8E4F0_9SPHN|nr:alpha/beta hydrolase [Novosphingobium decolorationis]QVM83879.1 alpha/beta hydrolase [Novosphingobium decolorationis]
MAAGSTASPPRRGYVDGPFGQIHYRRTGTGRPLVLVHQAAMDSRQFTAVYGLLAEAGFDAIGIDLPGFGNSDCPPFPPRVEDLAASIVAAIDALGLERFDMAGHHTGAMVATEVALALPERVQRLVLNGPMPLTDAERSAFFADKHLREKEIVPKPGGQHFAEFTAIRERLVAGSLPLETVNSYVLQALGAPSPFWYGHNAGFQYRHEDSLPRLACPTLILTNTGDQIYAHAQRARALRPDMAYAELEGGGVDIIDQQPEAWTKTLTEFLT